MDVFVLNDGNKLPTVALGTSRIKPDEMDDVIKSAIDIGYCHFDSAQLYPTCSVLGKALFKALSARNIKREELFVSTKLSFFYNRPEDVRPSMIECLEKLGLDYVDLFLIHHPAGLKKDAMAYHNSALRNARGYIPYHEKADHIAIWKEMEKLVEDKLTKSIGVSNFNKDQLSQLLQYPDIKIKPAVLQIECHVSLQEKEMVKFCNDNNIVVFGYAALGSPNLNMPGLSCGSGMVNDAVVSDMARRYNKSTAQILLRYSIQRGVGIVVKSSNVERLKENIDIFGFKLSKTDYDELSGLDRGERIFNYPFQIHHPQNPYPSVTTDFV